MLHEAGVFANRSQQAKSIQLRHHDVRQHQSRAQLARGVQRLAAIRNGVHLISIAEQPHEVFAHVRVVIGHHDQFPFRPGNGPGEEPSDDSFASMGTSTGAVVRHPPSRLLDIRFGAIGVEADDCSA